MSKHLHVWLQTCIHEEHSFCTYQTAISNDIDEVFVGYDVCKQQFFQVADGSVPGNLALANRLTMQSGHGQSTHDVIQMAVVQDTVLH